MAIALWLIPASVASQSIPSEATQSLDDNQESEVIKPVSQPITPHSSSTQPQKKLESNSQYYIEPRIAPDQRINPFTTTLPLNNIPISHLTNWEILGNSTFGDNFEQDLGFTGILKLSSQVKESLSRNNIFQTDQIGTYLQLQTVRKNREISTITTKTENLLGLELQMTLIGNCLFGDGEPTEECTYIPGLVIDRDSIDPELLVPTKIFHTSNVGDIVTPESLAAIEQPGFQRGANGQELGLDLYFPNIGTISSEENNSNTKREEEIELTPVGTLSRVRQVVKANATEAVIGRTVKGMTLIEDNEGDFPNSALSAVSFLLPDAIPRLEGSEQKFNPNVNQNLFLAANNTRLPSDSFTIYHGGLGKAKSISTDSENTRQIPAAHFNSIWFGLSPVVDRESSNTSYYEPSGKIEIIADVGGEGRADSEVQLVSIINGEEFSSGTLQNVYGQIYLKFFSQEADLINMSSLREKTNYYSHLSFSGNITKSQNVLRYYTGAIFDDPFKAYLGADYNHHTFNDWKFSVGGIGYFNPDREYYSQLWGNVVKKITINPQTQLNIFTGFNYAIDRPNRFREVILSSLTSSVTLGARAKWHRISLGANYNFDDLLPNSLEKRLLLDLGIALSDRFYLSGYYTPINSNTSRSRYGANASLRLGKSYNHPTLTLGWTNNEYQFENGFTQSDNVVTLLFRLGEPANPFNATTAEKLRREETSNFEQQQQEGTRE